MIRWLVAAMGGWVVGVAQQPAERIDPELVGPILDRAELLLSTRHSYGVASGIDVPEEVSRSRASIGEVPVPPDLLVRELQRLLAMTGDGHAQVRHMSRDSQLQDGLPIACMALDLRPGGRVVATEPDGAGLVDADHPFLVAIDGVEIERWLEIAREIATGGSVHARRAGACRALGRVGWIRERLDVDPASTVRLTLGSGDGSKTEVSRDLLESDSRGFRQQPFDVLADAEFAYIPIRSMWNPSADRETASAFAELRRNLDAARDAKGVILDIRGNRGGVREVLYLVASYVLAQESDPVVFSAARVLMWDRRDDERVQWQLESRRLFLPDDPRWTPSERGAIREFLDRFEPEVELDGRFGPLHVAVLSPAGPGNGALAGKPIVVLIDERCISAADVFAAGLKELPGVTLVGRPTSGASGMSQWTDIGYGIELKVSTMVSFMADGGVFDWHGVRPDIEVELVPEDFTRAGNDTALERALDVLRVAQ